MRGSRTAVGVWNNVFGTKHPLSAGEVRTTPNAAPHVVADVETVYCV